ncbi:MAG: aldehyde dehydrogenase family protein [Planctomycetia bacterium]
MEPILIAGTWRAARAIDSFRAIDPTTGIARESVWPVSDWADADAALDAAMRAADELRRIPDARRAIFLEAYASRLEARATDLIATAHAETGLPVSPRLADAEMPRMLDQLRQAAQAAREGTWRMAMIDTRTNIRSAAFGIGPVVIFPPANFPFAYGCLTGGDFASALAAGNPVIAKAHPGHPGVSRIAAAEAVAALSEHGLPTATVQLLHGLSPGDGERIVADPRVGATGFTGGQQAGMKLFAAAAAAGRVMWVEMGSVNPVVLLPEALADRGSQIAEELTASVTGSSGQVCIKPGIVFLVDDPAGSAFVKMIADRFRGIGAQVLLGPSGRDRLVRSIASLRDAGATAIVDDGAVRAGAPGPCTHRPTLLDVGGSAFLADPEAFLVEAFGNATLLVRCESLEELARAVAGVHGSLAASIYASHDGRDEPAFAAIAAVLVDKAGRVVENRMTTGMAVTPPMQHGGPWPSAAPPFYSAVGMPFSILRYARRICFDGWSQPHLPEILRDAEPPGHPWRFIDGAWTRGAA